MLTQAAIEALQAHGDERQKALYLPRWCPASGRAPWT
jgi:hypothetical protein